jgi:hypothetical protein
MAAAVLLGEAELRRQLGRLGTTVSRSAVRSGMSAGMTVLAKEVRRQVNAVSLPAGIEHAASLKRGVRKAVGKRFARYQLRAIVGFGAGFKGERRTRTMSAAETLGVHVSAQNVHWFILGTDTMPGFFKECVPAAASAAGEPAAQRAVEKARERFLSAARRRR